MAKNIRRILAMVMVMCMLVSALPMQALAAEEELTLTETDTISGEGVTVTFGSDNSVTVSGTNDSGADVSMSGTVESGTTSDGSSYTTVDMPNGTETTASGTVKDVDYQETTTTTTTETPDGGTQSVTVKEGFEDKEWTGEGVENVEGYEGNENLKLPSLEVKVQPGTTTVTEQNKVITGTVGDIKEGDDDKEYNYTEITIEVNREVTVNSSEIKEDFQIIPDKTDSESKIHCPVAPENYEGKEVYHGEDNNCDSNDTNKYDVHYLDGVFSNGKDYLEDKAFGDGTPAVDKKPTGEGFNEGYDLIWTGYGDQTDGAVVVFVENPVWMIDENGNKVLDMEKSTFGSSGKSDGKAKYDPLLGGTSTGGGKETGMNNQANMFALKHENGEYFYAYCMDAETGAAPDYNRWYHIRNLEDAVAGEGTDGYITENDAAMIRAIALNGYWGTESGQGSVESLKALMKETYNEDSKVTVRYPNDNTAYEYDIWELIDGLSESEALAVTQAAIWTFANAGEDSSKVVAGVLSASKYHNTRKDINDPNYSERWLSQYRPAKLGVTDEELLKEIGESDARLQALYDCLLGLKPVTADSELSKDSTVIPQEDALTDISLVIEDRVADHEDNLDDNTENDVYNVALNFELAFTPGEKDELYIELTDGNKDDPQTIRDANNNPIKKKLVSHDYVAAEEEQESNLLRPNADGVYTLSGLELSENSSYTFDLRLTGTQYLENGVYIYQAYDKQAGETTRKASQTLVGLAEGEQQVALSNKMTLSFDVNEKNHVVEHQIWRSESDPIITPPEEPETPPTTPPEYPVTPANDDFVVEEEPPQIFRLNNQDGLETIPEEPVPLAAPVITGDNSAMWMAVVLFALFGMVAINLSDKKRQYETF